jgi:3-oxoacyl-[acyl-carrier protein] reductase
VTCDLSNAEQVEKLVPAALDALGKIDILVNNAGITRDNLPCG